jgi:hypothetical protein
MSLHKETIDEHSGFRLVNKFPFRVSSSQTRFTVSYQTIAVVMTLPIFTSLVLGRFNRVMYEE